MIVDLEKRWMNDQVPCRKHDPETFFGDHGQETLTSPSPKTQLRWNRVKEICYPCPVIRQCARDHLGEVDGIWGGLDPAERIRLRAQHAISIEKLRGPLKNEYGELVRMLRRERGLAWSDVGRIVGISATAAQGLCEKYEAWLEKRKAKDSERTEESLATVTEIGPNAHFPDKPPQDGDAWVRYGRRVVWGHYLGQTEDDAWYFLKVKLLASEYSTCWIKAEDVKLTKGVCRNVLVRSGASGSRIYGTPLSPRRRQPAEAG